MKRPRLLAVLLLIALVLVVLLALLTLILAAVLVLVVAVLHENTSFRLLWNLFLPSGEKNIQKILKNLIDKAGSG